MDNYPGIVPFTPRHIQPFMALAGKEGWIVDPWEFDFLQGAFPQGCFCAVDRLRPLGFVTSVRYGRSGWIGNLIVSPSARGGGIGTMLMRRAIAALEKEGAETVWLTASEAGEPIYQKLGFTKIDRICRWRASAGIAETENEATTDLSPLMDLDASAWGDRRRSLICAVAGRGMVKEAAGGFLVVQPCGRDRQIGPWVAGSAAGADALLQKVLQPEGCSAEVFLDVPEGNRGAGLLLIRYGFRWTGSVSLMFRGVKPHYLPQNLYALATMGSMG